MLDQVVNKVKTHRPRQLAAAARAEAAVLVPMTRTESPEIILTLRASGLSTHSGEVAFPGGHQDTTDPDLIYTALREAEEEIGLAPGLVEVVGPMSQLVSLHGVKVTPIVGIVPSFLEYKANEAEIASVFSVPLDFFANDPRSITHRIDYLGESWYVPSYFFQGYKIWGLTAVMIVELINVIYGLNIDLRVPPAQLTERE
ncbi:CoA pyrophosphatase [Thiopseudomonas alkaliphila]|uniref:CoA pyrophosphatase n=1 Tax=Thiopseudomonas alkaliphila TaxID=1697053 RepID=A0AAW7DQG2_9GAMM|nr:CoA pyrophosphatase [Thiopseudomonas alkaliphila]MDM1696390.1 CoA pyrophosphatase [Thiopseudomonas alkaliphila]MDM1708606.1 CoA pyrophosphatase [Thiopseudomonas alkaliphila]